MIAVGIDIIQTERLQKALKQKGFAQRVFLPQEIAYCQSFRLSAERYAGIFACKEAVMKACKTCGQYFDQIEVTHDTNGAPKIILHGQYATMFDQNKIQISISHIDTVGVAIAVLEN